DLSWPEIGIRTAKNVIDNYSNETVSKIQKALEKQGPKTFAYQVIVLAHSLAGDSWSVATEQSGIAHRNGYTNITNINGLDVHIFRFNRTDDAERNSKAEEWIQEKHDALTQAM
ncbi:hypothetical protein PRIPAC_93100, partial [Pristionchus pacificus]|uniref:Uncharacterized protein n=1 Tax=Pristionchus pacificus TaxID=54126 RepID=A0A2A6CIA5_PRIPA